MKKLIFTVTLLTLSLQGLYASTKKKETKLFDPNKLIISPSPSLRDHKLPLLDIKQEERVDLQLFEQSYYLIAFYNGRKVFQYDFALESKLPNKIKKSQQNESWLALIKGEDDKYQLKEIKKIGDFQ